MLRCPHCRSSRLRVLGTAHDPRTESHEHLRRHRKCKACGRNFHTREIVEGTEPALTSEEVRIALGFMARAAYTLRRQKPRKDFTKD